MQAATYKVIGKKVHGNNVHGKNGHGIKVHPKMKKAEKCPHQSGKIVHILVNLFTRNLIVFVCTI